ncbi:hypothetical protein HanRHA438_Chr16g0748731 [Helianthus annuus]|nr:hypothetical protein HanRHA438_Chr16g0748731 [Helianthus annuus]
MLKIVKFEVPNITWSDGRSIGWLSNRTAIRSTFSPSKLIEKSLSVKSAIAIRSDCGSIGWQSDRTVVRPAT